MNTGDSSALLNRARNAIPFLLLSITISCSTDGPDQGGAKDLQILDGRLDLTDVREGTGGELSATDAGGDGTGRVDASDDTQDHPEAAVLWEQGPPVPELPQFITSKPWLAELSLWSHAVEDKSAQGAEVWEYPDLGLGNGVVFSLIGYKGPTNRLHSMVGPGYERGAEFFSDTWIELSEKGVDGAKWGQQWIGRVKGTAVVLTYLEYPFAALTTVDAAVSTPTHTDPLRRTIIRSATIRNLTDKPLSELHLHLRFARQQEAMNWGEGGQRQGVTEERGGKTRTTLVLTDHPSVRGDKELSVTIGNLAQNTEETVSIAYVVSDSPQQLDSTIAALSDAEPVELLHNTWSHWRERLATSTTIDTPDPMVGDYIETQLLVNLTQQSAGGAVCPMSQYTHAWTRDTAGPVRFLLSVGLFEEARRNLDYLWYASSVGGGLKNAYPGDLEPVLPVTSQPNWESMPVMTGHTRAEGPSHIPLMYYWYFKASGKLDFIPERLGMMEHALFKQAFEGDLLPFSGDETYRAAMAVAHDLPLLEEFVEGYYSAYSSFLWVVGAKALIGMLQAAGVQRQEGKLEAKLQSVEKALNETFLRNDGAYAPYVKADTLEKADALFEDVSMQPLWLGMVDPQTTSATDNLSVAIKQLDGEDGILVTPLPDSYKGLMGLPIEKGIYTGMNPGYYLRALAAADHPLATEAFNAMSLHAVGCGTTPEYQMLDGFFPLHILYNEYGVEPADYTARYRPWEGGINGEAVLYFLLGHEQDAPNNRLTLAPHLPNGWKWLKAKNIRVGDSAIDARFDSEPGGWKVVLENRAGGPVTVSLTLPLDTESTATQAFVNANEVDANVVSTAWGTLRLSLADILLEPGGMAAVDVKWKRSR